MSSGTVKWKTIDETVRDIENDTCSYDGTLRISIPLPIVFPGYALAKFHQIAR